MTRSIFNILSSVRLMNCREHLGKVLLVFLSCATFFAVTEITLALFAPHKETARPFDHIKSFFCEYHPILGWINKPNYHDVVTVEDDIHFYVTHNSRGLRAKEHSYRRSAGTKRILAMGDSFTWGFGVEDSQVFTKILNNSAHALDVVNMGVPGYATDQEFLLYKQEGQKYDHDLVILVFFANDLNEAAKSITYGYPKPYTLPDINPLTFFNIPVPKSKDSDRKLFGNPQTISGKITKFLRRNTHTYPFISSRLNSIHWLRNILLRIGIADDNDRTAPAFPYHEVREYEKRWQLVMRLIREFRSSASEKSADFLLVNIPMREELEGKPLGYRGTTSNDKFENDLINWMLQDFAKKNGIQFVNLLKPVREGYMNGIRYYSTSEYDNHLNSEGHRLLAETLLRWMTEKGFIL